MNRLPTTTPLRPHRLAAALLVALLPAAAMAAPSLEFNTDLLYGDIDVSRFEREGHLPGIYTVDVRVNGTIVGKHDVEVRAVDGVDRLCLSSELFEMMGLHTSKIDDLRGKAEHADLLPLPEGVTCEDIARFVPSSTMNLDTAQQMLDVSVPHAYVARNSGWVDPSRWDSGINAMLLNYSVSHSMAEYGGVRSSYTGGSIDAGVNLGAWRLRHSGYFSKSSGSKASYDAGTTYAQREIRRFNAQLTLGEASTEGDLFTGFGYTGANMRTDPRMLPDTARNYAPIIRGVAQTHARVTIRQRDHVIYETTVAPGPFEIDDLRNAAGGGDLDVVVTEADGRVESFTVPYAAVPGLLREGQNRFSVTAGQLRDERTDAPTFVQATLRRGVSNGFTGYAGVLLGEGYGAMVLGGAVNTRIGAFSGDVTFSDTRISSDVEGFGRRMQGQSYRLAYSRRLSDATSLNLAAYRYSTDGYLDFSDAARLQGALAAGETRQGISRQRSRLDLTLSHRFGQGSLYMQGSTADYWNTDQRSTNFSVGYSGRLGPASYNINARRTLTSSLSGGPTKASDSANLSIYLPLGRAPSAPRASTSVSTSGAGTSFQANLDGQFGARQQGSYNLSYGQSAHARDMGASVGYMGSSATVGASWNRSAGGQTLGVSASGSMVVHGEGVALSQRTGDTVGLLHVPGAANAAVGHGLGLRTNSKGYAVVPYLSAYQHNEVSVDPKGLPMDVELKSGSTTAVPTAGAVVKMVIPTSVGRSALIEALDGQSQVLPFGLDVYDEHGQVVGIVGQGSRLWVRGINEKGLLRVDHRAGGQRGCTIAYDLAAAGDAPIHTSICTPASATVADTTANDSGYDVAHRSPN